MDTDPASINPPMDARNVTRTEIGRWNIQVPSYLYREIPAIFHMIGIILNATIIIYFIKSKRYDSPLFAILTSLAAMDMCVCLGGLLNVLAMPIMILPEVGAMCGLAVFIVMLGMTGSEYHLIFFTALRFYQVMSPLKARASVTVGLVVKWCIVIIVLSIINAGWLAAYWRSLTTVIDGEHVTVCIFVGDNFSRDTVYLFIITLIPCVSIFLIHVLKYFAYIRSKDFVGTYHERNSPDARVAAIIITLFYICWVPALIFLTMQQSKILDYAYNMDNLFLILMHLMFANSIVDSLVYVLAVKSIRNDAITLFCSRCKSSE